MIYMANEMKNIQKVFQADSYVNFMYISSEIEFFEKFATQIEL
jgi:hypothetical protein